MAGSQARKNKKENPVNNEDVNNPEILKATIKNLKLSFRGNNPESDKALEVALAVLEEQLKKAKGGNPNTQKRPIESRPWR